VIAADGWYQPHDDGRTPVGAREWRSLLLIHCELRLLNGQTMDFEGNTPTSLNHPDLDPDNTSTAADINTAGTHVLGELPMGQGRGEPGNAGNSYVHSLLVIAKVFPSIAPNPTYTWKRVYRDRGVIIKKASDGTHWDVSAVNNAQNHCGFPTPELDTGDSAFYTIVPSPKNVLYIYDNAGAQLQMFAACGAGDYAYEETDFTYTLTTQWGSLSASEGMHVGQTILAQRVATSGIVATDWVGKGNIINTSNIPSCQITEAKIRQIVGGNVPIVLDPHVNDPDP
jgi:hypothetical protein